MDHESLCVEIHDTLRGQLASIVELGTADIPSESQRQGYILMRDLLELAETLSASLRYDVGQDHTTCQIHDEMMRDKVNRIHTELAKMGW